MVYSSWHLTNRLGECTGMMCVLAAAGDKGQQAVSQVVEQLNQDPLGGEPAHIQGTCKPRPLATNCLQHAAHSLHLQITKQ